MGATEPNEFCVQVNKSEGSASVVDLLSDTVGEDLTEHVDDEREEGEIVDDYEFIISSDEELCMRQRIEELEATNAELEKIAHITDDYPNQYSYLGKHDVQFVNSDRSPLASINIISSMDSQRASKVPTDASSISSVELLPTPKKRKRRISKASRKEHKLDQKNQYRRSDFRKHKHGYKRRSISRIRHQKDVDEPIQLDSHESSDCSFSVNESSTCYLSREELRFALARSSNKDKNTGNLKDRLTKKLFDMNEANDFETYRSELRSPEPIVVENDNSNDSVSLEEQELRLIALKSAVMKKHMARKKRDAEVAYSPTDFDDMLSGSAMLSQVVDLDIEELENDTRNSMEISPVASPKLNLTPDNAENSLMSMASDIDATEAVDTKLVDMDIANSQSEEESHPFNNDEKWMSVKEIPLPVASEPSFEMPQNPSYDGIFYPTPYLNFYTKSHLQPPPLPPSVSDIDEVPPPPPPFHLHSVPSEAIFLNKVKSCENANKIGSESQSSNETNSANIIVEDKKDDNEEEKYICSPNRKHVQSDEDNDEEEAALRALLLSKIHSPKLIKPKIISSKLNSPPVMSDISQEAEDPETLRSMLLTSLGNRKSCQNPTESILKEAVRRLKKKTQYGNCSENSEKIQNFIRQGSKKHAHILEALKSQTNRLGDKIVHSTGLLEDKAKSLNCEDPNVEELEIKESLGTLEGENKINSAEKGNHLDLSLNPRSKVKVTENPTNNQPTKDSLEKLGKEINIESDEIRDDLELSINSRSKVKVIETPTNNKKIKENLGKLKKEIKFKSGEKKDHIELSINSLSQSEVMETPINTKQVTKKIDEEQPKEKRVKGMNEVQKDAVKAFENASPSQAKPDVLLPTSGECAAQDIQAVISSTKFSQNLTHQAKFPKETSALTVNQAEEKDSLDSFLSSPLNKENIEEIVCRTLNSSEKNSVNHLKKTLPSRSNKIVKPNKVINTQTVNKRKSAEIMPNLSKKLKISSSPASPTPSPNAVTNCNSSRLVTNADISSFQVNKLVIKIGPSESETSEDEMLSCDPDLNMSKTESFNKITSKDNYYYDNASPISLAMNSPADTPQRANSPKSETYIDNGVKDISKCFEQKLDTFLKSVRAKVQHRATKNDGVEKKPCVEVSKTLATPLAVRHLPHASQQEYRRLVHRMQLLEQRKQAKKIESGMILQNVLDIGPLSNDASPIVSCKNAGTEYKPSASSNDNSRKALIKSCLLKSANSTIVASESSSKQTKKSNALISKSNVLRAYENSFLKTGAGIISNLDKSLKLVEEAKQAKITKLSCEKRMHELRIEMEDLQQKLKQGQVKIRKIYPEICASNDVITALKQRRSKLFKAATSLGKTLKGEEYRLNNDLKQLISVRSRKLAAEIKLVNAMQIPDIEKILNKDATEVEKLELSIPERKNLSIRKVSATKNDLEPSTSGTEQVETGVSHIIDTTDLKQSCDHVHCADNTQCKTSSDSTIKQMEEHCLNKRVDENSDKTVLCENDNKPFLEETINPEHNVEPAKENNEVMSRKITLADGEESNENPFKSRSVPEYVSPIAYIKTEERSLDPNGIVCPYDLMGQCVDSTCNFIHLGVKCSAKKQENETKNVP